jgi:hypothetical protein
MSVLNSYPGPFPTTESSRFSLDPSRCNETGANCHPFIASLVLHTIPSAPTRGPFQSTTSLSKTMVLSRAQRHSASGVRTCTCLSCVRGERSHFGGDLSVASFLYFARSIFGAPFFLAPQPPITFSPWQWLLHQPLQACKKHQQWTPFMQRSYQQHPTPTVGTHNCSSI